MKRAGVVAIVVGLGVQAHAQAWTQPPAAPPAAPVVVEEAPAPASLLVAVLDLKGGAGAESKASALTTMLTSEVSAQANRRAISRNELQGLLTQQATAQLVGCDDPRCMADVAKLANADEVIAGTVEKLDGATVIGLSLMRTDGPDGPQIVARQKAAWRGSDDELLLVVRPLVQRLFDAQHAHEHVGGLSLFAPAGSTVVVDGTAVGTAPIAPMATLPTGVHRVQVSQGGYVTSDIDVVIARNETTISRIELVAEPITSQPWFWAATSGVVLAAAGGVGAVVYFASTNSAGTHAVLGTPQ
jgi:hypothetical protein